MKELNKIHAPYSIMRAADALGEVVALRAILSKATRYMMQTVGGSEYPLIQEALAVLPKTDIAHFCNTDAIPPKEEALEDKKE